MAGLFYVTELVPALLQSNRKVCVLLPYLNAELTRVECGCHLPILLLLSNCSALSSSPFVRSVPDLPAAVVAVKWHEKGVKTAKRAAGEEQERSIRFCRDATPPPLAIVTLP